MDALATELRGDPSAGYFAAHRARYVADLAAIEGLHRGGPILEIGALPCHLTYCLKALGLPQQGVDLDPARMAAFITRHGLDVITCDLERERLPFPDDHFALVVMSEVFEHLRIDPIAALREVTRVTRPGGHVRLTTPNLYALRNVLTFVRGRGLLDPYVEFDKLHGTGHMGHFREYAAYEITRFLERLGLRVDEVAYESYGPSWRGPAGKLLLRVVPELRPYLAITATKR